MGIFIYIAFNTDFYYLQINFITTGVLACNTILFKWKIEDYDRNTHMFLYIHMCVCLCALTISLTSESKSRTSNKSAAKGTDNIASGIYLYSGLHGSKKVFFVMKENHWGRPRHQARPYRHPNQEFHLLSQCRRLCNGGTNCTGVKMGSAWR